MVILIHSTPASPAPTTEDKFHLVFEEVGLMANSANYLLSEMPINMTVLEQSVKELEDILTLQIDFVIKEIKGPEEILPIKKTLLGSLQIHMSDAEAQLERVRRL
jgi:hypothetical protein